MKSVGEAMAIGRTFAEAWGKAMRSRELDASPRLSGSVAEPLWDRYDTIFGRLRGGEGTAAIEAESAVHPWFLDEFARIVAAEGRSPGAGSPTWTPRRCARPSATGSAIPAWRS